MARKKEKEDKDETNRNSKTELSPAISVITLNAPWG